MTKEGAKAKHKRRLAWISVLVLLASGCSKAVPQLALSLYAGYSHNIPPCNGSHCQTIVPRNGPKLRAVFVSIGGIAVDSKTGDLYVVDHTASQLKVVRASGMVQTIAGSPYEGKCVRRDGLGASARFCGPVGVAFDSVRRTLYVADYANSAVRRVTLSGLVTTLVETPAHREQFTIIQPCALRPAKLPTLCGPTGIAVDPVSGAVFVSDSADMVIVKISPTGRVDSLAGMPGSCGYADGRGSSARFCFPEGLAFDAQAGALLVADTNNNRIRQVDLTGRVSTVAGMSYPSGPSEGVTDIGNGECRDFNGIESFLALCGPYGVAHDADTGAIYIADTLNSEIRKMWRGRSSTIAGHYVWLGGFSWGSGHWCYPKPPYDQHSICAPLSIALDPVRRRLYFADGVSGQVWRLDGL